MAKEIFSIYVCTRWAPDSEFLQILQNEISTEQLPKMEPGKLYSKGRFIPLRCSENFQVFSHVALGETSFENFEQQMKSLAEWYGAEKERGSAKSIKSKVEPGAFMCFWGIQSACRPLTVPGCSHSVGKDGAVSDRLAKLTGRRTTGKF